MLSLSELALFAGIASAYVVSNGTTCYLYPESQTHLGRNVDDTPSIHQAFDQCGTNGTVVFTEGTFHLNTVLNTTGLLNCVVELKGELLFSTNVPYWLSHSINVGLQNQSTAWLFGGTNVTFLGQGGSINGNGQTWYDENQNHSNQPGRPITITFSNSTNLWIENLRIIQQQFWATFVTYSQNVTMKDVYVNGTSNSRWNTVNTDGSDTWNSRDILMENWTVVTGDDCIAAKGNTTNLHVKNVTCYGGAGMTIGAYIKTWQGDTAGVSSNGDAGGGGSGLVRNITFKDFDMVNCSLPLQITQCIYTEDAGACETSKMQIEDIHFENITATSRYNIAASL
ncbi:hypothetical protein LTR86_008808 [Recurvomyces mirabilis]|nr:hypothetical protein LTR86_008808 [Recurvomyces mirabilis]